MGDLDKTFNRLEYRYRTAWNQYYNQRKQTGTEGQGGSRTALEKQHRHTESLNTRRWAIGRESSVTESGNAAAVFLQFWVNPSECAWKTGLRSAVDKTSGGAVHYEIPQVDLKSGRTLSNFTRLDLPVLDISFQSGIITPGGYNHVDNGNIPNIMPYGLANFYDFINLVDQANITAEGLPNYINIMYVSATQGGQGIWLRGFFEEDGISWTDSAENPTTITNWTASFLVCHSNPPLNKLRRSFQTIVNR